MKRLAPEDRKRLITRQLLPLFAKQGFAATNSRQMANAAGVSEALLYKYFPTKDHIYKDIEQECHGESSRAIALVQQLPNSMETAVLIVYGMLRQIILGNPEAWYEQGDFVRLMFHSYLSDKAFAELTHNEFVEPLVSKLNACVLAAVRTGDAVKTGVSGHDAAWFCHHIAAMSALVPIKDDGLATVQDATRFCLRGLGFTDEALNRALNFKKLAARFEELRAAASESR